MIFCLIFINSKNNRNNFAEGTEISMKKNENKNLILYNSKKKTFQNVEIQNLMGENIILDVFSETPHCSVKS